MDLHTTTEIVTPRSKADLAELGPADAVVRHHHRPPTDAGLVELQLVRASTEDDPPR